jgi:hypothetical protein
VAAALSNADSERSRFVMADSRGRSGGRPVRRLAADQAQLRIAPLGVGHYGVLVHAAASEQVGGLDDEPGLFGVG